MPEPPLALPDPVLTDVENHIQNTISSGTHIRSVLAGHSNKGPWNTTWEVDAAVEALHVFGSRWTIEILSTLYIAGPRRFNQLKTLLAGISSRTLSDKLRFLVEEELVIRQVDDGPPVRVDYILSEHGITCGRLLSPLVAHLKIRNGSLKSSK
ncbi:MAG: helix-turn-helix transcriptional regulator [Candidatus Poseidoniales archaeon]|nr:helix-turn-helix transcriptional regulator [Candidatus Poseidoniales archaeon]|tara:strand:+ start:2804 stop:3262 length:459 start_codon:yes stop_codon:yes gene_type:complete